MLWSVYVGERKTQTDEAKENKKKKTNVMRTSMYRMRRIEENGAEVR